MITESDLRAVFADEAQDVSEPADVMARLAFTQPPGRNWRAWLAPLAAAAAVVTIVSVAVAVAGNRTGVKAGAGGHTLPPMPGRDLRFAVTVGAVAGYQATGSYLVADREATDIALASDDQVTAGEVVAYAAGAYDPAAVRRGRPVRVQGHEGYFAVSSSSAAKVDHVPNSHSVATLAWEFAADRWVVVQGWDASGTPALQTLHLDAFTEEMRVARAVDTSASASLLLPYRVGYLPAGLRHGGGRDTVPSSRDWQSYLWFLGPGQHGPDPSPPGLAISVNPKGTGGIAYGTFAIDGHPAIFEPASADRPLTPSMRVSTAPGTATPRARVVPPTAKSAARSVSGGVASLTVDFGPAVVTIHGNYSKDELVQVAHSMTLASDVNDQRTWFDATR